MNFTIFMYGLLAVSIFTTLTVQAIKIVLKDVNKKLPKNILASVVSLILSVGLSVGYAIVQNIQITGSYIVFTILLMLLGWLSACLGYDKIKLAIEELTKGGVSK